jgi:hypothetical protein
MNRFTIGACLFVIVPWIGCVNQASLRKAPVTPPVQATAAPDPRTHLLGQWELPGKDGKMKLLIFEPGGQLKFQGGLEYYNPATWRLDPDRQELTISLPGAPNEKLDIFKLYVGEGVKAFDRAQKQVTYHFDATIWDLNVAGWPYHKSETSNNSAAPLAEPVFK